MARNDKNEKARYWVGVLYPENMVAGWQDDIGDIIELPYAYCIHEGEKDGAQDERKKHVHLIIAFANTTTYNNALATFKLLGEKSINTCEKIRNIRSKYEYLIHNTETCKKKGKKLYPESARITGNNFDIGLYEQVTVADKDRMCRELADVIIAKSFTNFADFYFFAMRNYDSSYFEVIKTYSGFFERLIKGVYQKYCG